MMKQTPLHMKAWRKLKYIDVSTYSNDIDDLETHALHVGGQTN